jgi:hypothetical protein
MKLKLKIIKILTKTKWLEDEKEGLISVSIGGKKEFRVVWYFKNRKNPLENVFGISYFSSTFVAS